MRLRTRLTLATVSMSLLAIVLVAAFGTVLATRVLEARAVRDVETTARLAVGVRDAVLQARELDARSGRQNRLGTVAERAADRALENLLSQLGATVTPLRINDLDSAVVGLVELDDIRAIRAGNSVSGRGVVNDVEVIWAAVPGDPPWIGATDADGIDEVARQIGVRLFIAGLLGVLGVGIVGLVVGDRLARPVRELEDAVDEIRSGRLDRRVPESVSGRVDEIGDLARGVDAMAAGLEEARADQRGFFRSVAHELRTPLTNIRGYAEGLQDGRFSDAGAAAAHAVIHDESLRLTRLVDDVMTLARLDAGDFTIEAHEVEIGAVMGAAVAAARVVADEAGVVTRLAPPVEDRRGSVAVTTDPDRVQQVLDNLIANALRVTPTGGIVELDLAVTPADVRIAVADSGPGIDDGDLGIAFERYGLWRRYRGEREVGTGLGLAIVDELVRRLGGRVEVEGRGRLGGAVFTVVLPRRA